MAQLVGEERASIRLGRPPGTRREGDVLADGESLGRDLVRQPPGAVVGMDAHVAEVAVEEPFHRMAQGPRQRPSTAGQVPAHSLGVDRGSTTGPSVPTSDPGGKIRRASSE